MGMVRLIVKVPKVWADPSPVMATLTFPGEAEEDPNACADPSPVIATFWFGVWSAIGGLGSCEINEG